MSYVASLILMQSLVRSEQLLSFALIHVFKQVEELISLGKILGEQGLFNQAKQGREGRRIKELLSLQFYAKACLSASHQLHRQEGMSSDLKEIILRHGLFFWQEFAPKRGQFLLK